MQKVKLLVILIPLIIPLIWLAVNGVAARSVSAEIIEIRAKGVEGDKLVADAQIMLINKGLLPVSILGGKVKFYLNGVKLLETKIPTIFLLGGSEKNVTISALVESAEIYVNGSAEATVEGYVNSPFPIPFSYSEEKELTFEGKGYQLVDVVGLPGKRFLAKVKVNLPAPIYGITINTTIQVPNDFNEPMIITVDDTELSGAEELFDALIYIPSNRTIEVLASGATTARATLVMHKESWALKIIVNSEGAKQDAPLPPADIESVTISGDEIIVRVAFNNPYSLKATLLHLNGSVYADGVLIARLRAENQTIAPKSKNVVEIAVKIIEENATALLTADYITVTGKAYVKVEDTVYVIPIREKVRL